MGKSLDMLKKAIQGTATMSEELDSMYLRMQNGQVPANWEAVGYLSLKPLASWYKDLVERVDTLRRWLVGGNPSSYWMSGFFFP